MKTKVTGHFVRTIWKEREKKVNKSFHAELIYFPFNSYMLDETRLSRASFNYLLNLFLLSLIICLLAEADL